MTSLSALSTTAINDGQQGSFSHSHHHRPHGLASSHHHSGSAASATSTNTIDAERADRISRLPGLERVSTVRQSSGGQLLPGTNPQSGHVQHPLSVYSSTSQQPIGYFDPQGNPQVRKERSTVGSASATASIGGDRTTTWASASDETYDPDKMSVGDREMESGDGDTGTPMDDNMSSAGLSDGGKESLVGFGEGANSTVSGPISTPREGSLAAKIAHERAAGRGAFGFGAQGTAAMGMQGVQGVKDQQTQARATGSAGMDSMGTATGMEGVETAEMIVGDRIGSQEGGMNTPDQGGLGKFPFEGR